MNNISHVHIRIIKHNRKKKTVIQGVNTEYNANILRFFKNFYCIKGNIIGDPELGTVIYLDGDCRENVARFIDTHHIVKRDQIIIH